MTDAVHPPFNDDDRPSSPKPTELVRELDTAAGYLARKLREVVRARIATADELGRTVRELEADLERDGAAIAELRDALRKLGHDPDQFTADIVDEAAPAPAA